MAEVAEEEEYEEEEEEEDEEEEEEEEGLVWRVQPSEGRAESRLQLRQDGGSTVVETSLHYKISRFHKSDKHTNLRVRLVRFCVNI